MRRLFMADTLFDVKDGIAIVTLNRPEKLNSLTMVQLEELSQKANEFEQDDAVRAIIITATGKGFSTGADLSGGGGRPDMTTGMGICCKIKMAKVAKQKSIKLQLEIP